MPPEVLPDIGRLGVVCDNRPMNLSLIKATFIYPKNKANCNCLRSKVASQGITRLIALELPGCLGPSVEVASHQCIRFKVH